MSANIDLRALSDRGAAPAHRGLSSAVRRALDFRGVGAFRRVLVVLLVVLVIAVMFLCAFAGPFSSTPQFLVVLYALVFAILAVIVAVLVRDMVVGTQRFNPAGASGERARRLQQFARDNGMAYSAVAYGPRFAGMIFRRGASPYSYNVFTDQFVTRTRITIGNYQTGTSESDVESWGYLALPLGRSRPHILLKNRAIRLPFSTPLPESYGEDQVLSLEGNFDRSFRLYCPGGLERASLELLTPDLMALLIDSAADYDLEIVGSMMYLYSASPFDLDSAHTWTKLEAIIDTVGRKARRGADLPRRPSPSRRLRFSFASTVWQWMDRELGRFAPLVIGGGIISLAFTIILMAMTIMYLPRWGISGGGRGAAGTARRSCAR